MAKPFENSDIPNSPQLPSNSTSSLPSNQLPASRKRARDSDDDSTNIGEDVQKTRRVNPQRLAARLGADLVADMEAYIYPGAKMPTFEVRRVLQERYAVDRRHVYDYFHSRGLRVAKEDKHTNLTRGRLSKALAKQSLASDATVRNPADSALAPEKENHPLESPTIGGQSVDKQPIARPVVPLRHWSVKHKATAEPEELSSRNAKLVATERISGLKKRRRRRILSGGASDSTAYTVERTLPPERLTVVPSLSAPQTQVVVPSNSRAKSPSRARSPSPCPEFTLFDDSLKFQSEEPDFPVFHPSPDLLIDIYDTEVTLRMPLGDNQGDSLSTVEQHRSLTQLERLELYNLINNNIGTSSGIEECAGTYSAYMKERSRHYFDRISFKASYGGRIYRAYPDELRSSTKAIGDDVAQVDFKKWLSSPDKELRDLWATRPSQLSSLALRLDELGDSSLSPSQFHVKRNKAGLEHASRGSVAAEVPNALHYDYDVKLSPQRTAPSLAGSTISISRQFHYFESDKRPSCPPTPCVQIEASKPSVTILDSSAPPATQFQTAGFMDMYLRTPSSNVIRPGLYASTPARFRTTSGGGI
ncbi:hypothetical protein DXG03_008387 [Asterophora parasitica]|uniref:Uncharacterized protein n=1 Tax=Asterophora parasitica TaxID=117018 RepID=A0A9P7GBW4_9AGAR|nr:hypothetical protein DXG03_008387 [Asterophora parasitica]